jgi:hypothetical protein
MVNLPQTWVVIFFPAGFSYHTRFSKFKRPAMPCYPHLRKGLRLHHLYLALGPSQGAVENPAGARPSKCIIIIIDLTELVKTDPRQFQAMSDSGYSGSDDEAVFDTENLSDYDFSDECLDRIRFRSSESAVQVLKAKTFSERRNHKTVFSAVLFLWITFSGQNQDTKSWLSLSNMAEPTRESVHEGSMLCYRSETLFAAHLSNASCHRTSSGGECDRNYFTYEANLSSRLLDL